VAPSINRRQETRQRRRMSLFGIRQLCAFCRRGDHVAPALATWATATGPNICDGCAKLWRGDRERLDYSVPDGAQPIQMPCSTVLTGIGGIDCMGYRTLALIAMDRGYPDVDEEEKAEAKRLIAKLGDWNCPNCKGAGNFTAYMEERC